MIKYLDIINKIKDVKIDSITYFNEKVSMPMVLASLNYSIRTENESIFVENDVRTVELTALDRMAYTEILYVLKNVETELLKKINFKYIDFFERFKYKELNIDIDFDKLSIETLKIISILNIKFWCDNDEIRKEFLENMNPKEKFDFKIECNNKEREKEEIKENVEIAKLTWWNSFLNKIRKFKKNNGN